MFVELPETHKNLNGFLEKFWTENLPDAALTDMFRQWAPVVGWLGNMPEIKTGAELVEHLKTYTFGDIPQGALVKDKTDVTKVFKTTGDAKLVNTQYDEEVDRVIWSVVHEDSQTILDFGVKYLVVDKTILKFD